MHPALPAFHLEDVSLHLASFVCISASVVNGAPRPGAFVPKRSFLYPGACSFVPPQRAAEVPGGFGGAGSQLVTGARRGKIAPSRAKKVDGDCRTFSGEKLSSTLQGRSEDQAAFLRILWRVFQGGEHFWGVGECMPLVLRGSHLGGSGDSLAILEQIELGLQDQHFKNNPCAISLSPIIHFSSHLGTSTHFTKTFSSDFIREVVERKEKPFLPLQEDWGKKKKNSYWLRLLNCSFEVTQS